MVSPTDSVPPWHTLGRVAPATLVEPRLMLHYAAQPLASFGQALIEPRGDDSHRSMTWDDGEGVLSTDRSPGGLRARLRVPTFELVVERNGEEIGSTDLAGMRPSRALAWLGEVLAGAGEAGVTLDWPEYDLPDAPGGPDAALSPDGDALDELCLWFHNAASVLAHAFDDLPETSALRCWPHHFDLGVLMTYPASGEDGEDAYVGAGLSPGDQGRPAPYYYVNGWPAPDPGDLPPLRTLGTWNTDGWVGGVLEAEDIVSAADGAEQARIVAEFLDTTAEVLRRTVRTFSSDH